MASAWLKTSRRLDMRQSEACYHQPYNRELVCQCRHTTNYLSLSLSQFVDTARQEVGDWRVSVMSVYRLTGVVRPDSPDTHSDPPV